MTAAPAGRLALTTLAVALAGCGAPLNEPPGLLGAGLEGLSPRGPGLPPATEPSLRGLDRSHWPTVRLRVPTGQVEHYPSYVGPVQGLPSAGYPTTSTALDIGIEPGHELLQALWQPVHAVTRIFWWPVEMASGSVPWRAERSPGPGYPREGPRPAYGRALRPGGPPSP